MCSKDLSALRHNNGWGALFVLARKTSLVTGIENLPPRRKALENSLSQAPDVADSGTWTPF